MTDMTPRAGLSVDAGLATFLEGEVLTPLGRDVQAFWQGFAALLAQFAPRNAALLAKRDSLQAQIDAWHMERAGKPHDAAAYKAFLTEIGYLVAEPGDFQIGTQNVDPEIATMAGPQLVVPILNARFLLNAANARERQAGHRGERTRYRARTSSAPSEAPRSAVAQSAGCGAAG